MSGYLFVVGLLRFAVDLLLLTGTKQLTGGRHGVLSSSLAALCSGFHGVLCMMEGFGFLKHGIWYLVCLAVVCLIAFGYHRDAYRRWSAFLLMHLAMNCAVRWMKEGGVASGMIGLIGIAGLVMMSFSGRENPCRLLPLVLTYGNKTVKVTALYDTGNQLRDPVTGQGVLVIGAETAVRLTGLTHHQLKHPIETMAEGILPGLRLIPYQSIGQPTGLMLAMRFPNIILDGNNLSAIVAFAPAGLDQSEDYQALTGGYGL